MLTFRFLTLLPGLMIASLLLSQPAIAGPGEIENPWVEKGEAEIENIGVFSFDDDEADEWEHEITMEYGLFERVRVEIGAEIKKEEDESTEYSATEIGTVIQLTETGTHPLDAGLELEYKIASEDDVADAVEAALLFGTETEYWSALANISLKQEVGSDSEEDLVFGASFGYYRLLTDEVNVGFEYFGELGELGDMPGFDDQDHSIGPVFSTEFEWPDSDLEFETQLGYFAGISDGAADHAIKYIVELEF